MFLESAKQSGWLEVICGSMFSGKTEELIRRLKRANFAKQRVQIFKPSIDNRYSDTDVVSHEGHSIQSISVDSSQNILLYATDVDVVGIDEVQFFDEGMGLVHHRIRSQIERNHTTGLFCQTDRFLDKFVILNQITFDVEDVVAVKRIFLDIIGA